MPATIITYANLGEKSDAAAGDILPVVDVLLRHQELDRLVCKTNRGFRSARTYSAIPLFVYYVIRLVEKVFRFSFSRRALEDFFDYCAQWKIGSPEVVFFHGGFFLPRSLARSQVRGAVSVDIARTAHFKKNAELEREEFTRLGVPEYKGVYTKLLEKHKHLNHFDYVVAISEFVAQSYIEAGYPSEKIFVANLDVDCQRFYPQDKTDDIFRVLYIANTTPLKGLHYLLEAWRSANLPGAELLIVGKFAHESIPEGLKAHYDELIEHNESIRLIGTTENPEQYYHQASVFCLPSLTEGLARVSLEAMACGLPIVTTENAQGLVEDGKSGFVVPIRDAEALKEKLEYLYHNHDLAKKMGREARRMVENKKPFGEEVYNIYREILSNKRYEVRN